MRYPIVLLLTMTASARAQAPSDIGLDHIILSIPNLAAGIEQFTAATGVNPKFGGRHPGRGTENALVALGNGRYLEILARVDGKAEPGAHLTPNGWAVHTTALASVLERVRGAGVQIMGPIPGSRRTPDSTLLQWRTGNVGGPGLELAPFVIEWATGTPHPSTTSPAGCTLESWELLVPDDKKLGTYLAALPFEVTVHHAEKDGFRLTLQCPKGRVTFGP